MSDNVAQEIEYFKELSKPFSPDEVKKHPARGFEYITARTVQLRLDKVCGPARWTVAYDELKQGGVKCTLSIQSPNGEWYQRDAMAGPSTHMNDTCDAVKASCSEAFKVAASNFGIGRELYGDGETYYPGEAVPVKPEKPKPTRTDAAKPKATKTETKIGRPPKAGNPKAPYAWLKSLEEKFGEEIVKPLARKMEDNGRSWDTRSWDDDNIETARGLLYEQFCGHANYDGCLDPGPSPVAAKPTAGDELQDRIAAAKVVRPELRDRAVDAVTALVESALYKADEFNLARAAEELAKKATGKTVTIKSLTTEMRVPLLDAVANAAEHILMTGEEFDFGTLAF